jgi:hypothetical protein
MDTHNQTLLKLSYIVYVTRCSVYVKLLLLKLDSIYDTKSQNEFFSCNRGYTKQNKTHIHPISSPIIFQLLNYLNQTRVAGM